MDSSSPSSPSSPAPSKRRSRSRSRRFPSNSTKAQPFHGGTHRKTRSVNNAAHNNNSNNDSRPLRTSDRLRASHRRNRRTNRHMHSFLDSNRRRKPNTRRRVSATHIAKMLHNRGHNLRRSGNSNPSAVAENNTNEQTLRRSTRKRKTSINMDLYETDTDTEDADLMPRTYRSSMSNHEHNHSQDEHSSPVRHKKNRAPSFPRREGLRPRRSTRTTMHQSLPDSEDEEQEFSEADDDRDEGEGGDEAEDDGDEDVEEDEVEEEGEEQEGQRRYALRTRTEVRRFSPKKEEKQRPRSPARRVLHQGMGTKNGREGRRGRMHKRHRTQRVDDSDDSLLVDEMDQGPIGAWTRGGRGFVQPWNSGGLDLHSTTLWGLNVAASGWGHQGDFFGMGGGIGAQTAGPSSKGGADIQPLQVDEDVSFEDIGGLSDYINALKEMVFFPLLYPDFFANYHITPPRGVLLCGPPGTGKTLIARALACAASKAGQKVNFYMRKGADVLSKWVGEAERQLKLLFEEAQKNQPSIIFFDEIDGLAPVRSSKQEQIHNSIVSTLLALMDGLDSRGQVVLIGATNRIDAIDGALRRPGRFDREFVFPLPDCKARAEILEIHTRKWKERLTEELRNELAAACVGYCGADLKALCTEAAIRAFRERYPQVYSSDDQFVIDVNAVKVEKRHFWEAMSSITPAAHRGTTVCSRPLSPVVAPCLKYHLDKIRGIISAIFPALTVNNTKGKSNSVSQSLVKQCGSSYSSLISCFYRPRLLLCETGGNGLDHIGPAVLHDLEKFPVHSLGVSTLFSDPSAKSIEEALVHVMIEAKRTMPSILYLPQFNTWWETAHEQLKGTLLSTLAELPSDLPILLLATSSVPFHEMDEEAASIFDPRYVYELQTPDSDARFELFAQLIEALLAIPEEEAAQAPLNIAPTQLVKMPKVGKGPNENELRLKAEAEEHALRRLRMCLRDICNRLLSEKRFSIFHYPVLDEDAPGYYSIVQNPMDVATLLQRVDKGQYLTCSAFLQDVDLIPANAKAYNGDDYGGARIVSRALALKDAVHGMLSQMDPALVSFCDEIAAQGGPTQLPQDSKQKVPSRPVVQQVHVTRASARLRNVQPELNTYQNCELSKRSKRFNDFEQGPSAGGSSGAGLTEEKCQPMEIDLTEQNDTSMKFAQYTGDVTGHEVERINADVPNDNAKSENAVSHPASIDKAHKAESTSSGEGTSSTKVNKQLLAEAELVKQRLVELTQGFGVTDLQRLYTSVCQGVNRLSVPHDNTAIIKFLVGFVSDVNNIKSHATPLEPSD